MSQVILDLFHSGADQQEEEEADELDYSRLGRYAEFMVCAELTKIGYHAIHADAPGFDIILIANARSYRVQVKSSTTVADGKGLWRCRVNTDAKRGPHSRKRPINNDDADILALFHHAYGKTIFTSVRGCTSNVAIPLAQIEAADTGLTLIEALK